MARLIYSMMVSLDGLPDQPPVEREWARQWRAAEKIVYSSTLAEPSGERTRIERAFDPEAVRRLEADATRDPTVNDPELAGHAMRAGLVDEIHPIVCPVLMGGGKRFFPEGVRSKPELLEERGFSSGVVALRYAVHH